VTGVGLPPVADTFDSGPRMFAANTITPLSPQLAPRPSGASQSVCTEPPDAGIRLSFPLEKKAIDWPSGDQNGSCGSAVPASGCAVRASRDRVHSCVVPLPAAA